MNFFVFVQPWRILKIFIFPILILTLLQPLASQHTLMRTYNINDGLVSNQVRGFYQDHAGFIWIITWEGLSRFEGHSFRNYTAAGQLAHPMVNAMIEGENGELYIAENDGTVDVIINGAVDISRRIKHNTAINKLIADKPGKIYAPSDASGISLFEKGNLIPLNSSGREISVGDFVTYNDLFFVCGSYNGVITTDHQNVKSWPGQTGDYNCLLKDSMTLWIGTPNGLLWVDLSDDQYNLIISPYYLYNWSKWNIKSLLKSSDGSIYISAIGGLIRIMKDKTWRLYTRSDGLPSEYITSVFEDSKGYIWIGTDQGIARLDVKNTIDVFTISEKLTDIAVSDIQPTADGSALVISDGRVIRVKSNQVNEEIDIPVSDIPYSFLIINDDTLVVTTRGRRKISGNKTQPWNKMPFTLEMFSIPWRDCILSSYSNKIIVACDGETFVDSTLTDHVLQCQEICLMSCGWD